MKILKIRKHICKIGKNASENWDLLKHSQPSHLFFHLSSFPSCFVIFEYDDKPDLETMVECAKLCKNNTKYKKLKHLYVDCTRCSNVMIGEKVGEIEYKSLRKLFKIKV